MNKTKTDKRLELVSRQIDELKDRIDKDTEKLKKYKAEYEKLMARKISEFAKSEKLVLTDKFFEKLSVVNRLEAEGLDVADLYSLFGNHAAESSSPDTPVQADDTVRSDNMADNTTEMQEDDSDEVN